MPFALHRERTVQYALQEVARSEETALAEGKLWLLHQLTAQLDENGSVTDMRFSHYIEGDILVVTMQAECYEQLGMETPVYYGE